MKDESIKYTLITGASTGLGEAFARECAQRGHNLILVSLPEEHLDKLCQELTTRYQVQVVWRETDLTDRILLEELATWVKEHYAVNMLINNAGVGGSRMFEEAPPDYIDNIIQLNIRAMTLITRLLLPELIRQPQAHILNVSSLVAFSPVPYKTVYPASKAFIHHFSLGLRAELRNTNVRVSVLCPGPLLTNSNVTRRINNQSFYIRLSIMKPEKAAHIAVKKLLRGKAVIIPGLFNQFNSLLIHCAPLGFRVKCGTTIFEREMRKNPVP